MSSDSSSSCVPVWVARRQKATRSNRAGDTTPWITAEFNTISNEFCTDEGDKWLREDTTEELFLRNTITSADMTALDHIHEPAVLSNLADRWREKTKKPYTFMSVVLISLNPCEWLVNPRFDAYRELPFDSNNPHPYALAELAFQQLSLASTERAAAANVLNNDDGDMIPTSPLLAKPGGDVAHHKHHHHHHHISKKDRPQDESTTTPVNQSIIISGESGAGKTETAKMILPYLTQCGSAMLKKASSNGATTTTNNGDERAYSLDAKLVQTNPIFECFGNAKTLRNHNSSRFGKFTTLTFEPCASTNSNQSNDLVLKCGHLETYLLERSRVTAPSLGERNFHSFYQLLSADLSVRQQVDLDQSKPQDFHWLSCTQCLTDKRLSDFSDWKVTENAMKTCGLDDQERCQVWGAISAILHLGNLKFETVSGGSGRASAGSSAPISSPNSGRPKEAHNDLVAVSDEGIAMVAKLLAISDVKALKKFLTMRSINTVQETLLIPLSAIDASHCRDGLARFLYDAVFEHLVSAMNATILDLNTESCSTNDVVGGVNSELDSEDEVVDSEEEKSEYESEYESDDVGLSPDSAVIRFKHDVEAQLSTAGKLKRNLDTTFTSGTPTRSLSPSPRAYDSDGGYRSYTPSPPRKKKVKKVKQTMKSKASINNGNKQSSKANTAVKAVKRNVNIAHHLKNKNSLPWIGILDIFGFEHFDINGFQTFLINTANESIQNTFNHFVFEAELRLFREEGISLQMGNRWKHMGGDSDDEDDQALGGESEFICPDNQACEDALKVILKSIESVSREPEPSDAKFLRRITNQLLAKDANSSVASSSSSASNKPSERPSDFFRGGGRKGVKMDAFAIRHFAGEVCYTASDWMAKNTDYLPEGSSELLGGSTSCILSKFHSSSASATPVTASALKAANSSFLKKATVADNFMKSMQSLMSTLRSTQCSFIRCVKPNQQLSPSNLDLPLVASQLQSLGIIQTCEVLKAGLPTRVPHAVLLGSSGIGSTPPSIAQLMANKPVIVRIALLLKLFDVPHDTYRVGKTKIFFRAGNIAAIRRILVQGLPMNESEAVRITKELLKQYDDAMRLAQKVCEVAQAIGPGSIAKGESHKAEVKALLSGIVQVKERMKNAASDANSLDAIAVKQRVAEVKSRVKVLASDDRFVGLRSVTLLLRRAQDHAQVALSGAEGLASDLAEAVAACKRFEDELTEATESLSGKDTLEKDVNDLVQLAFSLDAPTVALVANQAALRLELKVVHALKKRCEKIGARMTPILNRMSERIKHFSHTIEPGLNDLSTAADSALTRVKHQQVVVSEALDAAEDIVRPEVGECDRVWIEEEIRVLEAISTEECKRPNKPKAHQGVLSNHEAEIVRARFFAAADEDANAAGGQGKRGLSKQAFKKLIVKLCDESAKAGSGLLVGIPDTKDLDTAFELADSDGNGSVDATEFISLYSQVKIGEVSGLSIPQRSFALLVNCRRRRPGWKIVGEELLRRHPPSIRRTNQAGVTALAAACHAGHIDVVKWCIEKGAEINKGNMDGVTPVATAAARGHLDVVRELVECGADVMTGNADGDSVVAIACWEDHFNIVRFLGSHRTKVKLDSRNLDGITPLEVACMRGNLKSVMTLHELGVNMDEVNEHGDTPFLIACWEGHIDVVKFLFRVGGGSAANRMNANGDTPLAVAAWEGHLHIVEFLVAVGVELQVRNADGLTAYDVAVMRQHLEVISFFQSIGVFNSQSLASTNYSRGESAAHSLAISHMISQEKELLRQKSAQEFRAGLFAEGGTTSPLTTDPATSSSSQNSSTKTSPERKEGNDLESKLSSSSTSPNTMVKLSLLKAAANSSPRKLKSVEEADREGLLALSTDAPKKAVPPPSSSTQEKSTTPEPYPTKQGQEEAKVISGNNGGESLVAEPKKLNRGRAAAAAKLSARISVDTPILRRSMSSSGFPSSQSSNNLVGLSVNNDSEAHEVDDDEDGDEEVNEYDGNEEGLASEDKASNNAAASQPPSTPPRTNPSTHPATPLSVTARKSRWDTPFLGKRVLVSGTNKKDINGCIGHASRFDSKTGRYVIKLENGRSFQLKASHLREWTPPSADGKNEDTPNRRESKWSRVRDQFHSAFNTSSSITNTKQDMVVPNGTPDASANENNRNSNNDNSSPGMTKSTSSGNLVAGAAGFWEKKVAASAAPPPTRPVRNPPRRTVSASAYSNLTSRASPPINQNNASESNNQGNKSKGPSPPASTGKVRKAIRRNSENIQSFTMGRSMGRSSTSDNVMGSVSKTLFGDKNNQSYAKDDQDLNGKSSDEETLSTVVGNPSAVIDPASEEYAERARQKLEWPAEYSHLNEKKHTSRRSPSFGKSASSQNKQPDTPIPQTMTSRPAIRRATHSSGSTSHEIVADAITQAKAALEKSEKSESTNNSPSSDISNGISPLLNKQVVIKGTVKAEANGRMGNAIKFDAALGRYIVRLDDGRLLRLKPQNLVLFEETNEAVQQLVNSNAINSAAGITVGGGGNGNTPSKPAPLLQRTKSGSINERLALFEKKQSDRGIVNDRSRGMARDNNRTRSFSSSSIVKQSTVAWPPINTRSAKKTDTANSKDRTSPDHEEAVDKEKIQGVRAMFEKKASESSMNGAMPPLSPSRAGKTSPDKQVDASVSPPTVAPKPSNRRVGHALGDNIYKKWMTDKFAAADDDDLEASMDDAGKASPSASAGLKSRRSLANSYEVSDLQSSPMGGHASPSSPLLVKDSDRDEDTPPVVGHHPNASPPLLIPATYLPLRPTLAVAQKENSDTTPESPENSDSVPPSPDVESFTPAPAPMTAKPDTTEEEDKRSRKAISVTRPSLKAPATPPRKNKPNHSQSTTSNSVAASLLTPSALKRAKSQAEKSSQGGLTAMDTPRVKSSVDSENVGDALANQSVEQPIISVVTPPPRRKPTVATPTTTSLPASQQEEGEESVVSSTQSSVPPNTSNQPKDQSQPQAEEGGGMPTITSPLYKYAPGDRSVPRSYTLSNGLNVFIISDDPRLSKHASAFGVIEYNGHDAFEFGAIGQVTAKLDARPPPPGSPPGAAHDLEALFTFLQEEQYHPDDIAKAKANTEQLLKQLEKDATLRLQHALAHQQSSAAPAAPSPSVQASQPATGGRGGRTEAPKTRRLRGMKLKDLRGGARV